MDIYLESFHLRWLQIKEIYAVFFYLDNAIFKPSKMELFLVEFLNGYSCSDWLQSMWKFVLTKPVKQIFNWF